MARTTFLGVVHGFDILPDNMVRLTVVESQPSVYAQQNVAEMTREHTEKSSSAWSKLSFQQKQMPCPVKPGMGAFILRVPADTVRKHQVGVMSEVSVILDSYAVQVPRFVNNAWSTITNIRYDFVGFGVPDTLPQTKQDNGKK